jgi:pimeloyl-ACP methyl ester carboxylesterase
MRMSPGTLVAAVASSALLLLMTAGCTLIERSLLFFPSHDTGSNGLTPWTHDGTLIGFCRPVGSPRNVWLMLHGNGGQASHRAYAIPSFSPEDSVYILEYPGYGSRRGVPSREAFDEAARDAYLFLRESYPGTPVCVFGESIGSGPASTLVSLARPPDKIVLVVPFDQLSLVAKDHFPALLVSMILRDDWDNIEALLRYKGPVDIFGAVDDAVIPVKHAKALAAAIPQSRFTLIGGGHNDWSLPGKVRVRNP